MKKCAFLYRDNIFGLPTFECMVDLNEIEIVRLQPTHNADLAALIRSCLTEFGANRPGTVFYDEQTDHLYSVFEQAGSYYFVALHQGRLIGGAGIYPTQNLPKGTVELVKMYIHPAYRKIGLGRSLMQLCLRRAKQMGYTQIYLETMPELKRAIGMYEQFGFTYINQALGCSGHFGCDLHMVKPL